MKMAVFWDVALCSLVDIHVISEELTASIIRMMCKMYRKVGSDIGACWTRQSPGWTNQRGRQGPE
jgi:hypothetical protein